MAGRFLSVSSASQTADLARATVLALAESSDASWQKIAQDLLLLRNNGSAVEWHLVQGDLPWPRLGTPLFSEILRQGSLFAPELEELPEVEGAHRDLDELRANGYAMTLCCEENYPVQLLDAQQVPPFIFFAGEIVPSDSQGVAIIGTRDASDPALEAASRFASDLAKAGRTVVSGLAAGVDTAALTAALEANGRVVAVIGTGITRFYPAENRQLQNDIAQHGLLISQFLPRATPSKTSFPMRNAVMSAYAKASLVVQADDRSGARLQARIAAKQGRAVYLYEPIMKHESWAQTMVTKGEATFVTSVQDIG